MTNSIETIRTSSDVSKMLRELRDRLDVLTAERQRIADRYDENIWDDAATKKADEAIFKNEQEQKRVKKRIELLTYERDRLRLEEHRCAAEASFEEANRLSETVAEIYRAEYTRAAHTIALIAALDRHAHQLRQIAANAANQAKLKPYKPHTVPVTNRLAPGSRSKELHQVINLPNPLNHTSAFWQPQEIYRPNGWQIGGELNDSRKEMDFTIDLQAVLAAANPAQAFEKLLKDNPLAADAMQPAPPRKSGSGETTPRDTLPPEEREAFDEYEKYLRQNPNVVWQSWAGNVREEWMNRVADRKSHFVEAAE